MSYQTTIESGPSDGPLYIFAHGAGAPMDSPFMDDMSLRLARLGICVRRFEFPYMSDRRTTGKKRPPDRAPKLLARFAEVVSDAKGPVFIGGKSMGGRMATMLAAEGAEGNVTPLGVVIFGFPFHAPGRDVGDRLDHFKALKTPTLILQGTRDPFGKQEEAGDMLEPHFPSCLTVKWIDNGNHDLTPPKRSDRTPEQNLSEAAEAAAHFMHSHSKGL